MMDSRKFMYSGVALVLGLFLVFAKLGLDTPIPPDAPVQTPPLDQNVEPAAGEGSSDESLNTTGKQIKAVGEFIDDVNDAVATTEVDASPSPTDQTITGLGVVLNPVTGGLSSVIAGLVVGIGRLGREVKRRGDAIVEIDRHPSTPQAESQTLTADGFDTVRRVKKKRAKKARS